MASGLASHPNWDCAAETGLDFFHARYFSGAQGRFTGPDFSPRPQPTAYALRADPQTLNLYGYLRNNPLATVDADGHGDFAIMFSAWVTSNIAISGPKQFLQDIVVGGKKGAESFAYNTVKTAVALSQGRPSRAARQRLPIFCLLIISIVAGSVLAQSSSDSHLAPLCELQAKLAQGEHRNVQAEGVYLSGLEGQYLVTSDCSGRSTWIEFELRTHRLWKQLVRLSNRTDTEKHVSGDGDPVLVVFEGEFYGPRVPDPKLPEAIRKNYHPGWDPMNASMTKMVVHAIQRVQPLPADHPCAPPKSDPRQWPCFQNPAPVSRQEGPKAGLGVSYEAGHGQGAANPRHGNSVVIFNGGDAIDTGHTADPASPPPNAGGGWRVAATADFDGNGVPDLVWQNSSINQVNVN